MPSTNSSIDLTNLFPSLITSSKELDGSRELTIHKLIYPATKIAKKSHSYRWKSISPPVTLVGRVEGHRTIPRMQFGTHFVSYIQLSGVKEVNAPGTLSRNRPTAFSWIMVGIE